MGIEVEVVNVFADEQGNYGNPLGVVLDGAGLDTEAMQAITKQVGFSETVFIDDIERATLRIFTPAKELPLAGHPLVGTAWLLAEITGKTPDTLRPAKATAEVATWTEDSVVWIRGKVSDAPEWEFIEVESPAAVEALPVPPGPEYVHSVFWSWIDQAEGLVRARTFAEATGVTEDEATGSAALRLTANLQRPLTIRQGKGSVLYARPANDGFAEAGGFVVRQKSKQVDSP